MAEWWEWTGEPGTLQSNEASGIDWGASTQGGPGSWANQVTTDVANGQGDTESSIWGSLSGILGPGLSALGSLAGGAIGSTAAGGAAQLQSDALNRGIDLQTAQWLQQQGNLAPYLQAGQQGLATLQQLAGREQPGLPGQTASIDPRAYGMPNATPLWTPQNYTGPQAPNATDFTWTPQQGPRAQDFRYTPGGIPSAANYRYTPGAVPTLSGQELLANDPGVAFRMEQGRRALEGSAAARGGLLSGPTLAALQRQGQELGSQEYAQAWGRASQQAQLREQWGQAASTMGWQQAEAESRLREQVNQIASQQGWSQAQAEAVFREQQNQLASQQNWSQALAGQQNQFTQGLESAQWNQQQQQLASDQLYQRNMEQRNLIYTQDVARNQTDYERQQALYRQQLGQHLLPWEQASTLANLGGQATGMSGQQGQNATNAIANLLGQQGTAQAMGTLGSAGQWNTALAGGIGGIQNVLRGLNA